VAGDGLDIQGTWDAADLRRRWRSGRDTDFVHRRLFELAVAATARNATGRILEIAAAEAVNACRLSRGGLETVVLEPSPAMLEAARERMVEQGTHLTLVRGIGEMLPFRDHTFDRVLCESAIDHFAGPDLGMREMARVVKADGRVIISAVNYESFSTRLSRSAYWIGRRLGRVAPETLETKLFWDTPVPLEHSFECTYSKLLQLCGEYCELDEVIGVSMGWGVPGWSRVLAKFPSQRAAGMLNALDALARRVPRWADCVLMVWRPRKGVWRLPPDDVGLRVRRVDPTYQTTLRAERRFWARPWFSDALASAYVPPKVVAFANARLTGDPARPWLDDLLARGPFATSALLGCDDESNYAAAWHRAGGSRELDVYELSADLIRRAQAAVPLGARFVQTDLNFARLPAARYDVIWSSGTLHHLVNLEHLFDEVERALRPGGLFAVHDYVGETRFRCEPHRLERVNAALADVPVRFRRGGIEAIQPEKLGYAQSPFCAVRSADILPTARERFDVVHEGYTGALFPLLLVLDLQALERDAPEVLERLLGAEAAALADPSIRACDAYVVFRKR
jgi:ubiquinone/menaquinone biosynthesis C-methylase UbiE